MASETLLTEQDMKEFLRKYGDLIRQQCILLMGDTAAARDLERKVIMSIREKYEYQPLPEHCETMLIARCCILSSRMDFSASDAQPGAPESTQAAAPAVPAVPKEAVNAPAETPSGTSERKDNTENLPEEIRKIRITAAYDPAKTAVWLPNGLQPEEEHLQKVPEDPEEASEDERSVLHSIFNTVLMLTFLASIGFFLWKTGILRWLRRVMEGLFVYGA